MYPLSQNSSNQVMGATLGSPVAATQVPQDSPKSLWSVGGGGREDFFQCVQCVPMSYAVTVPKSGVLACGYQYGCVPDCGCYKQLDEGHHVKHNVLRQHKATQHCPPPPPPPPKKKISYPSIFSDFIHPKPPTPRLLSPPTKEIQNARLLIT